MTIDPKRVKEIFLEAAELSDEAGRAAYLSKACGGDAGLRARVEALLRSHDPQGSFLGTPAAVVPDPAPVGRASQPVRDGLGSPSYSDPGATEAFTGTPEPGVEAAPATGGENGVPDDEPLTFLAPPGRPDSLGRLGHYEVLQVLGRGGFGIVFRAFDEMLQRVVALKVMAPQLAATSPARKRFLREARSSAQVRHENVVRVYEVAEQPLPYLVMELIPGETLQQRLDRVGPVEPAEVVRVGRQIAEGLAAAHACDLIHRDIKPGNVLLEGGQHKVKITDFGLARAADDASISQSGIIAGTPMYMAPEQALGSKIDQRADLFSLGSVLYQMTSGRPPFRANSALSVLKRVAEDTPRDIREIIPETPQWLCDIIAKLHAKDPDERYQSAREVADVLADCEAQLKANSKLKDYSRIPRSKPRRSGRWRWVAAAAAVLIPVIALAVMELAGVTHLLQQQPTGALAPKNDPKVAPKSHPKADRSPIGPPPATKTPAAPPFTDADAQQIAALPDRRAAEYVISIGGIVRVNDQSRELIVAVDLPREPFRLTGVRLPNNQQVSDAGLAAFKGCKNVKELDVRRSRITDAGLAYFKDCQNLTQLEVSHTQITDAGAAYFKGRTNLTFLSLYNTQVSEAALAYFKDNKGLRILSLTNVSDAGLSNFKDCKDLMGLFLHSAGVSDTGLIHFKDCKYLALLDLNSTRVSDAGLIPFRGCKTLKILRLQGTKVGDAGLAHFKGVPLKDLRIENTGITDLTPLEGMPLEDIRLTPKNITKGLDILRDMKSLKTIGIDWNQAWPTAEFWERYDNGEFK
jgi:eukaryotic-like serine/threonine-protein kinase